MKFNLQSMKTNCFYFEFIWDWKSTVKGKKKSRKNSLMKFS